jgi:hypothetical protein
MITGPQLEDKPAQPYVATRRQVTMQDFSSVIDQTCPELFAWLGKHGVAFGARFESYRADPRAEPDPSKWQTEVAVRVSEDHHKE